MLHSGATVDWAATTGVCGRRFSTRTSRWPDRTCTRACSGSRYRSEETDQLWKRAGQSILIAGAPDDPSVEAVAGEHGVTITLQTHLPEIDLYVGLVRE